MKAEMVPPQVLVPSSVFVSAQESRRADAVQRVRSFDGEQLAAAARDNRFDRVRIVVSQPYNKHCQVTFFPPSPTALDVSSHLCLYRFGCSTGCRSSTCLSRKTTQRGPAAASEGKQLWTRWVRGRRRSRPMTTSSAPENYSRCIARSNTHAGRPTQVLTGIS